MRLFALLLLAVILMFLDKHVTAMVQLRAILSIPIASLQYVVHFPIKLVDTLQETVSTHDSLVKENLNLKAEQLLLRAQVQRLLAIELENNELKALKRSSLQIRGRVLIAQLLSVSSNPFLNQVLLNKGSHDNVFVGQPVLDANGVMGQVVQVDRLTSRVLLINDAHSGLSIQVARNGMRAIAVGDAYSGKLKLLNVPQTADVQVGDVLMTSGLGENYPAGYPVGQIVKVVKDPGLQFLTILVEPAAHLERSRGVLLIWPGNNSNSR
ncbi:MAG: mreC [Gammaproteobacteria bacterium]|nr:mreC [Gammaproteobacteria bacterium]MCE3238307.1 mreC [Gammaproteobacteria bacterium]